MLPKSMPAAALLGLALSLFTLGGCSAKSDERAGPVTMEPGVPEGDCNALLTAFEGGGAVHVEECSPIDYPMSPPVFGNHYPIWAAYQSYDYEVPLGYLVHDLEHGAVVFFYDCPDGCTDEVAEVQAFIDALPEDRRCAPFQLAHQVVLVPRAELGSRWAASAWGFSVTADCFDAERFGAFYDAHHGQGPEDLCNQGAVVGPDACP